MPAIDIWCVWDGRMRCRRGGGNDRACNWQHRSRNSDPRHGSGRRSIDDCSVRASARARYSLVGAGRGRREGEPLLNRPDAAAGGAKLFQQRCATCHGDEGRGTSKAPLLRGPDIRAQTDGQLYWKISTGKTHASMPTFSFLPEVQRWQLVLHVRAMGMRSSAPH